MGYNTIKLGALGEKKALSFLKANGFNILETNYRTRFCEIDIIAKDEDFICFIEVKTRRSLKKGLPKESVNLTKQKKILQGAQFFLKAKKLDNARVRFDVVEVYVNSESSIDAEHINLIKNAFWAS